MRSLSKKVKKDPHEYVYQGSKKMKIKDRGKLICKVCRKTSKRPSGIRLSGVQIKEVINMLSLSKNVKEDTQENV